MTIKHLFISATAILKESTTAAKLYFANFKKKKTMILFDHNSKVKLVLINSWTSGAHKAAKGISVEVLFNFSKHGIKI